MLTLPQEKRFCAGCLGHNGAIKTCDLWDCRAVVCDDCASATLRTCSCERKQRYCAAHLRDCSACGSVAIGPCCTHFDGQDVHRRRVPTDEFGYWCNGKAPSERGESSE